MENGSDVAEPVVNWRREAGPSKVFKGNGKKTGQRQSGMDKGGKPGSTLPC